MLEETSKLLEDLLRSNEYLISDGFTLLPVLFLILQVIEKPLEGEIRREFLDVPLELLVD